MPRRGVKTVTIPNAGSFYRTKVRLWRQHDSLRREARQFLKLTGDFEQSSESAGTLARDWERLRRRVAAHASEEEGLLKGRRLFDEVSAQHKRIRSIGRRIDEALLGECPAKPGQLKDLAHLWQGALLLHFLFEEQTVLAGVPSEQVRETLPAPLRV